MLQEGCLFLKLALIQKTPLKGEKKDGLPNKSIVRYIFHNCAQLKNIISIFETILINSEKSNHHLVIQNLINCNELIKW